ncbi:COMM domain-containing protein 2-like [Aricia agestis]|uniref:COMM domain-containing protein 2-like n=1 Tax=Aricia agestis TaxID=91739 RepID=UPI001C205C46|nr:COMM domain-containing protein 2-like [Aricia agestis]
MIIFLSDLQKQHLQLFHEHSVQVLVDFCKITIDFLNNGISHKKCTLAAEKLQISVADVQNVIHALSYLIIEACKHNLSESNLSSSLAIAGFSTDKQQVLVKFYNTKKTEIADALKVLQQREPSYQDLQWRFEVQVASRENEKEIKPMVTMDFVLSTPKSFGLSNEGNFQNKLSEIEINNSLQEAKTASQCQNIINHVILQCDLPNLMHLTNTLEVALKESKSQHVRKVQRAL